MRAAILGLALGGLALGLVQGGLALGHGGLVLGHGGLALGHGELTLGELAPRGLDLRHGCLALEGLALIAINDVSIAESLQATMYR